MLRNARRKFANQETEQYGMNPSAGMYQDVADIDTGVFNALLQLKKSERDALKNIENQRLAGELSHTPTSGFEDFLGGALPTLQIGTQIAKMTGGFGLGDDGTSGETAQAGESIGSVTDKTIGDDSKYLSNTINNLVNKKETGFMGKTINDIMGDNKPGFLNKSINNLTGMTSKLNKLSGTNTEGFMDMTEYTSQQDKEYSYLKNILGLDKSDLRKRLPLLSIKR